MAKNQSAGEGNKESAQSKDDFGTFENIAKVTEQIPKGFDSEKLRDVYEVWKEEGSKKQFDFQKLLDKVPKILKIYRRKWKGNQFISYVAKGQSEQVGMKTDIVYGENGAGEEDQSVIISRNRYPTIEYNEKLARKILEKAKRWLGDEVQLHFIFQSRNITVHKEENFFGDFDKLVENALEKKII